MSANSSHISQRFSEPIDPAEIAVALCNALFHDSDHRNCIPACSFTSHRRCALPNFNRGTIDSRSDISEYSARDVKT
jgi:hypothetical protein